MARQAKILTFDSSIVFVLSVFLLSINTCLARYSWDNLDRQIENKIYQLNVGIKIKLNNSLWVQVAGTSSKQQYYVFATSRDDKGYQIIGHGSCFPVFVAKQGKTFFITSNHVLDNVRLIKEECEMFYAALALYAKCSTAVGNERFQDLLNIINLSHKKNCNDAEKKLYQNTVNDIWDCYDKYLSKHADPARLLFNRYKKIAAIETKGADFLHIVGPATQSAIEAKVYRSARANDPDLCVLEAVAPGAITNSGRGLQLAASKPFQGEEIQAIGYPINKADLPRKQYYRPTFSTGKITKVAPHTFQFNAPITKGNSGGPVINQQGRVVGVVTIRAVTPQGIVLPNCGGAVNIEELKSFVPQLFNR